MHKDDRLSIGEVSRRTGTSISALRYYESHGLISSLRNQGGQRRFLRSEIRRVSFILIAQRLGFALEEIRQMLERLPNGRTPNAQDWAKISRQMKQRLEDQIATLERMRNSIEGCIGCGCLSLENCALYNPDDSIRGDGKGPRLALG